MTDPLDFAALVVAVRVAALDFAALADPGEDPVAATPRPESVSRCSRFRSARSSAATWYRTSRSFSNALFSMRSNSTGRLGFKVTGEIGAWRKILSKLTALVPPGNELCPVNILYSPTPRDTKPIPPSDPSTLTSYAHLSP